MLQNQRPKAGNVYSKANLDTFQCLELILIFTSYFNNLPVFCGAWLNCQTNLALTTPFSTDSKMKSYL